MLNIKKLKRHYRCFKKKFSRIFYSINLNQEAIPETERVARFIYDWKFVDKQKNRARPDAFDPDDCFPYELSVFRKDSLEEAKIWELAVPRKDVSLKARVEILVSKVNEISLTKDKFLKVLSFPYPHPLHANITNFPIEKRNDPLSISIKNTVKIMLADSADDIVRNPSTKKTKALR